MTLIEAANELSDALDPQHQAIRDYCHSGQEAREQIRMMDPIAQQQIGEEARWYNGSAPFSRLERALLQARRVLSEVR